MINDNENDLLSFEADLNSKLNIEMFKTLLDQNDLKLPTDNFSMAMASTGHNLPNTRTISVLEAINNSSKDLSVLLECMTDDEAEINNQLNSAV